VLQVYFIARSHPELETASYRTLDRAPLTFVRHEGLIAALRALASGARPTPERMLEYNGIVATASKRATVLPVRFGAAYRSEAAVARLLAERGRELLEALDRLEGKAELGLRIILDTPEQAREHAAGLARHGSALEVWHEIHPDPAGRTVLEVALLVSGAEVPACRARLQAEAGDVTGPWPPRHFLPRFLRAPVASERRSLRDRPAARRAG
jgi:gas vesicle protein GvpL/GvpF